MYNVVKSTVLQYGCLSILGVISNPTHIFVPHRIFDRIRIYFYWPSAPQAYYIASLPRLLQQMKSTRGASSAVQASKGTRTRCESVCKSVFIPLESRRFSSAFLSIIDHGVWEKSYRRADLPSALDTGTTTIFAIFPLRCPHVLWYV